MDYKLPFDSDGQAGKPIVYVRPVEVAELPQEVREQAGDEEVLYSVHDENGQRLALVKGRQLAFELARQNDMVPVNVH